MLRDHRPVYLNTARKAVNDAYAKHFLYPHFAAVGDGCHVQNPWHVTVFGGPVRLGRFVEVAAGRSAPVQFAVWRGPDGPGRIDVGDYSMINPGVRLTAACHIEIGRNALFAPNVYVTDTDWHDAYDRVYSLGGMGKITLEDNVWVGEGAVICKGVRIGQNSIVGARAVVTHDVGPNTVVAGNPARPIRQLDPDARYVSREHALSDPQAFLAEVRRQERAFLGDNTLAGYLRYLLWPRRGD